MYAYDVLSAVQYAIDQNIAPVISTSYGMCEGEVSAGEANAMRGWAKQANAQGITWFSASGDNGGADCAYIGSAALSVDMPGSIPEVTSVGGTEFSEGAGTVLGDEQQQCVRVGHRLHPGDVLERQRADWCAFGDGWGRQSVFREAELARRARRSGRYHAACA